MAVGGESEPIEGVGAANRPSKQDVEETVNLQYSMEPNEIVVVSGIPRSGTSMMMQMLKAGGVEILTDNHREADEHNRNGYYELDAVKGTCRDASWVNKAKNKAVKIIYQLLYDLPDDYQYRVVFMLRDITEILISQAKMLNKSFDNKLAEQFRVEIEKCMNWLDRSSNFKVLYIQYADVISDPLNQCCRIFNFLDRPSLDVQSMAGAVDAKQYRSKV